MAVIHVVISGGHGTRLWPLSRKYLPKPYLDLYNKKSLFEQTIERNSFVCDSRLIVTGEKTHFLAEQQLLRKGIPSKPMEYILESESKNTAPAITWAALSAHRDDILLITPADHHVTNQDAYQKTILQAIDTAKKDHIVLLGMKPEYAETAYGYIQADFDRALGKDSVAFPVAAFHEKPDDQTAQRYLEEDNFFWNSGIFCFKAGVFLDELAKHAPELNEACRRLYPSETSQGPTVIPLDKNNTVIAISIDHAVIEKSQNTIVIPSDFGWNDVGSLDALYKLLPKDTYGNGIIGNSEVLASSNNLIISNTRKIVMIDIEESLVMDTEDVLLICKKGSSQKVKEAVERVGKSEEKLLEYSVVTKKPWGSFTILAKENGYQVKRLTVFQNSRLSLQRHHHRSEHWQIISGTARVTIGDQESVLNEGVSVDIPKKTVHRLENVGTGDLVLIEIQRGSYLEEDDIERLEDDYNRL